MPAPLTLAVRAASAPGANTSRHRRNRAPKRTDCHDMMATRGGVGNLRHSRLDGTGREKGGWVGGGVVVVVVVVVVVGE